MKRTGRMVYVPLPTLNFIEELRTKDNLGRRSDAWDRATNYAKVGKTFFNMQVLFGADEKLFGLKRKRRE